MHENDQLAWMRAEHVQVGVRGEVTDRVGAPVAPRGIRPWADANHRPVRHDEVVWLQLEKSGVRNQRRDLGVEEFRDPHPELPPRDALVLTAAHSVFPESGTDVLPDLARRELAAGLTGPLRTALARREADDPAVDHFRDDLVSALSGDRSGLTAAVVVVDQVHLRRSVRGVVPAVIATGNLLWYGSYRSAADPAGDAITVLGRLYEEWRQRPDERVALEEEVRRIAVEVVGENPDDLLDVPV